MWVSRVQEPAAMVDDVPTSPSILTVWVRVPNDTANDTKERNKREKKRRRGLPPWPSLSPLKQILPFSFGFDNDVMPTLQQ